MTQYLDSNNLIEIQGTIEVTNEISGTIAPPIELEAVVEEPEELVGVMEEPIEVVGCVGQVLEINVDIIGTGPRGRPGRDGNLVPHPETHSANMIDETTDRVFVTEAQRNTIAGYIHDQIAAMPVWSIEHNLDKYPSVSIVDSGNNEVYGTIHYESKNTIVVTFTVGFSGKAYLN